MLDCEGRAKPVVLASSAPEEGSLSESAARLLRLERSRSVRPCAASALTLGALGKNCAKLTPGGGRVIVSMRSGYRLHRDLVMISRARAQAIQETKRSVVRVGRHTQPGTRFGLSPPTRPESRMAGSVGTVGRTAGIHRLSGGRQADRRKPM